MDAMKNDMSKPLTKQDSFSSKQPEKTVEKEEVRELAICFRGEPGMIITRVRTEATKRHMGRLRK